MDKVINATLIVFLAIVITTCIVSYVQWLFESERDNWFTVFGLLIFLIWLFLIFIQH